MRIHYLGHASFVLRFENGESILLDYGVSNAYGHSSPIFDISGGEPSIVAYSHDHPDHRRPGVSFPRSRVLAGGGNLRLDGLTIRSIRTSEASMDVADNTSFEITYGGFRILHLADAQAFISAIDDPAVKRRVKERYPDYYDLVFMTIDGPTDLAAQAAAFLEVLAPARAIPMHYWSQEAKADFMTELRRLNSSRRGGVDRFTIAETGCSDFSLYADSPARGTRVIGMDPAPLYLPPAMGERPQVGADLARPPFELYAALAAPLGREVAAGSLPRYRHISGAPPAHRPAVAASSAGRGSAGTVALPIRRHGLPQSPIRDHSLVPARTGRNPG